MDSPSRIPIRGSGIPRPSRAPVATTFSAPRIPKSSSNVQASRRQSLHPAYIQDDIPTKDSKRHVEQLSTQKKELTEDNFEGPLEEDAPSRPSRPAPKRKLRPSLSDCTIETLAQIPPSPSPGRRKSSFFTTQTPVTSPARPTSVTGIRRPSTSWHDAPPLPTAIPSSRSISPNKLPARPPGDHLKTSSTPTKRSIALTAPRKIPPSHSKRNGAIGTDALSSTKDLSTKRKAATRTSAGIPPSKAQTPQTKSIPPVEPRDTPPKSSAALRETIARAKAAHRAASTSQNNGRPSQTSRFKQDLPDIEIGGSNQAIIKKRLAAARGEGRLNLAAMSLKQLPPELLQMYDMMDANDGSWAESVDLIKLSVADNDIVTLDENFFPGKSSHAEDDPDSNGSHVLEWLETLDLHGNQLATLPSGLDHLQRLVVLNLSRNRLEDPSLNICCGLQALRELRLAENKLKDVGHSDLFSLPSLEVLDLSRNVISTIPGEIGKLSSLHTLVLTGNKLTGLPQELFSSMHLRELNVARNSLKSSLVSGSRLGIISLKMLDASFNALTSISNDPTLTMPHLQTLNISENRMKTLPELSTFTSLITLAADGNQLSDIPSGMITLDSLKNVDLSRNDLRQLDTQIGFMESLSVFSVANNPLRERRLLNMNTEDLRRELRDKQAADFGEPFQSHDTEIEGQATSQGYSVKSDGILDMSSTNLDGLERERLEGLTQGVPIKALKLMHNNFTSIPEAIEAIGSTLTMLDLANNRLGGDTYLTDSLYLPKLKVLNLSANMTTSLSSLSSRFTAPALTELNVSRNRLTSLPILRTSFPSLTSVQAADNKICELPYESVQGLQVLDVSGNEIGFLEPRIGLLAQEGLRMFLVGANTFRVPRRDVVEKGTEAILTWLRGRIPDH